MKLKKFIALMSLTMLITSCSNTLTPSNTEVLPPDNEEPLTSIIDPEQNSNKQEEIIPVSNFVDGAEAENNKEEQEVYDSKGNLLIPFDQAYPQYMNQTVFDQNSILVKAYKSHIKTIFNKVKSYGISSYEFVTNSTNEISWYKLNLDGAKSFEIINNLRALETTALMFDLNYIVEKEDIIATDNTEVDNCNIPNANNNKHFKDQYYFKSLGLKESYKYLNENGVPQGGHGVIVAVIDTGVDYNHQDLTQNIRVNSDEIPGNGVDDDENGYIDDYRGWNFVDENNNPDDDQGHGTHVAGIIAATNNNVGTVGVAYNSKIMAIKAGDGGGSFTQDRIAKAINYAYINGADVINMSFGGSYVSIAVQEALETAYTTAILVGAAGNDSLPNEEDPIAIPSFPAAFPYVIGVMSCDKNGSPSSFTNFDVTPYTNIEYEIYAPGEQIYSTIPNNLYTSLNGTSMAAPIVSGTAALLRSYYSDKTLYTTKFLMSQIINNSNPISETSEEKYQGCLNIYNAITKKASPKLVVGDYYIFDSKDISSNNNNNGLLDAGETVYLAPVIKNLGGIANDVNVFFDILSSVSSEESKYITIENSEINYGDIGVYSSKDYLIIDENSTSYSGANFSKCLKITVGNDVPNQITVNLNYYMTSTDLNGNKIFSPKKNDGNITKRSINLVLNRGVYLSKMIEEDMTLTKDKLWIVDTQVNILKDVTVTIEPGTTIQYGTAHSNKIYNANEIAEFIVYGKLISHGTEREPINFVTTEFENTCVLSIKRSSNNGPVLDFKYTIFNAFLYRIEGRDVSSFDHCKFYSFLTPSNLDLYNSIENYLNVEYVSNSLFEMFYMSSFYSGSAVVNSVINIDYIMYFDVLSLQNTTIIIDNDEYSFNFNYSIDFIGDGVNNPNFPTFIGGNGEINISNTYCTEKTIAITWEAAKLFYDMSIKNNISVPVNPKKHFSDNCDCDFPHSVTVPVLYKSSSNTIVCLDGTTIPYDETNLQLDSGKKDSDALANFYYTPYYEKYDSGIYGFTLIKLNNTASSPVTNEEYSLASTLRDLCVEEAYKTYYPEAMDSNINILTNNFEKVKIEVREFSLDTFDGYYIENCVNFNTDDLNTIDNCIIDRNDKPYRPYIGLVEDDYEGNEKLWPYVKKMKLTNSSGEIQSTFGNEIMNVELTFNRDMDMTIPVNVRFGSVAPYAEYTIDGDFVDYRTRKGQYKISTLLEAGTQYFNISGGGALGDTFLDIHECQKRLMFKIDTSHALAQSISGAGLDEGIQLTWTQDDYDNDTIMGYNIYRSYDKDGNYTKINRQVIDKNTNTYLDTTVEPGMTYYYTFTIVLSDFSESIPAGKTSVTAKDTMAPNIYHSPVYQGYTENELTIYCTISDNVSITEALLHYRVKGDTSFKTINMSSINNRYYATIPINDLSVEGIEYYISASDGTNTICCGTESNPYFVAIKDNSVIDNLGDVDNDGLITVKDAYMILNHIYGEIILTDDQFRRADLNNDGILSTSEALRILQYINGNVTSLQM